MLPSFPLPAPTLPPSRPMVIGFSSRSVDLSWTAPRPSSNSPRQILGYLVTVSEKRVKDADDVSFKKSEVVGTSSFCPCDQTPFFLFQGPILTNTSSTKFTVTGLNPFTVYAFQIQVEYQYSFLQWFSTVSEIRHMFSLVDILSNLSHPSSRQ